MPPEQFPSKSASERLPAGHVRMSGTSDVFAVVASALQAAWGHAPFHPMDRSGPKKLRFRECRNHWLRSPNNLRKYLQEQLQEGKKAEKEEKEGRKQDATDTKLTLPSWMEKAISPIVLALDPDMNRRHSARDLAKELEDVLEEAKSVHS